MKFRVGWIDTDASGRIHFTAVFRWLETAEMQLYEDLGLLEGSIRLPRRHLETDYLLPLTFGDEIDVQLSVERVGRTSINFTWQMLRDGEVAIAGRHTVVQVDDDWRPDPITGEARALLTAEEQQER
ncbi:MAG TPA: thioesterase family protein [Gaiellaceae bacterium]|jgi:YbgC/YbaW family acyl-CoA thioester hydrolase|nr:thioesterase family protein [Gaiellaceae bacterium]